MQKYWIFQGNNSRLLLRPLLDKRGNWVEAPEQEGTEFKVQFLWKPTVLSVRAYNQLDELFNKGFGIMLHNHLENNRIITTKPGLVRSLRQFYQTNELSIHSGYQTHDTIATSFIITAHCEDVEYQNFLARYEEIQNGFSNKERTPAKHCSKNMWLIKPAALNQGKGIEICRNLKEIKNILRSKEMHSVWLVQKYIERPLLFKGRKFDIRMWAIATGKNEFFYYRHGYLRTSSSEYDTEGKDNFIHLTNNCLQKFGENYGVHEKGNTLSFEAFQEYLDQEFGNLGINFWSHILPRIKDLMIDAFLSGKKYMKKGKRKLIFELLGFDFLIDEDFRVWLIEVNTNPYLGIPNEYIERLLPIMLDDLLALTVDPYFPPKNPRTRTENDYELLYCEVASIFSPDGAMKNFRQPYNTPIYPISELAQVPMCRMNHPNKEEDLVSPAIQEPAVYKPVARDTLFTVKEILDSSTVLDVSDFCDICSRVMSQLNNWELMSEEQISTSIQALCKITTSPIGASALVLYEHIPSLLELCTSENIPVNLQMGALEALATGFQEIKFRKEFVKQGISEFLINDVLSQNANENVAQLAMKAIYVISSNPAKNVYIPGETREYAWIRNKIISDGILICLYKLSKEIKDEAQKEEIIKHINTEFELKDWDFQLMVLDKIMQAEQSNSTSWTSPRSLSLPPRTRDPFKTSTESITNKDIEAKFPSCLLDAKFLLNIREEIRSLCSERREEIKSKLEREKQKKMEENEEKERQREQEDRAYEEKKLRAEEYAIRRYEEIRRQKALENKKKINEKSQEEKKDEQKIAEIIEKKKKNEEAKRLQKIKLKKMEESLKRQESEKKQEQEEKRKKALEGWLKNKEEKEAQKKAIEKQKREEEEARRAVEIQAKKEELLKKLEEKKEKIKKMKEENKEKEKKSKIEGGILTVEDTRVESIPNEIIKNTSSRHLQVNSNVTPNVREFRTKKRRLFEKKKKKIVSIPDKFLYEVYGVNPNTSHRIHLRSQSKNDISREKRIEEWIADQNRSRIQELAEYQSHANNL